LSAPNVHDFLPTIFCFYGVCINDHVTAVSESISMFLQDCLGAPSFTVSKTAGEISTGHDELLDGMELAAAAEEKETHSFEINPAHVPCRFKQKLL
jgi:hypothetical protein